MVRLQPTDRMDEATPKALIEYPRALGEDQKLRVARPRRLSGSRWFSTVHVCGREYRCTLVTWVPGERAPDARAFVEEERLRSAGTTAARMHERARGIPPEVARAVPRIDAETLFGDGGIVHLETLRQDIPGTLRDALFRACETMAEALEAQDEEPGLARADLEPQNRVFQAGRPGVIDFHEMRHASFALDLVNVLWTHAMWDDYPRFRESLFEGYRRVRPLPRGLGKGADALGAVSLFLWLHFLHQELLAGVRSRHEDYIEPAVRKIVSWCGVPI